MSKTLVIAEKPSVAADIVRAMTPVWGKMEKKDDYFEGDSHIVTSAVGHLLEIQAPESHDVKRGKWSFAHLPVIPPEFDVKPIDKTKSRLEAVVRLAKRKDVTSLVNACDAGREGELIFRLIVQYAKVKLPIMRLWLQSMTPAAIREGFASLRSDVQMAGLADAARSRSEADWLVGINGTRAMTAFNSREGGFFLTTVGRVQTPTLSIVVEREEKIRKFVARDYWEVHAVFQASAGDYAAKWFDPAYKRTAADKEAAEEDGKSLSKADRLWSLEDAKAIVDAVQGQRGRVTEESKPSQQSSPLLFDLTSLQREANGRFGFTAKTTLALAQALYEKHKALTYPRTDSRALPEDYLGVAKQTFEMLSKSKQSHLAPFAAQGLKEGYIKPIKRIFDNKKVSDHFAIIPTPEEPKGLSEAEQKIYDLVARRFLAVFFPPAQYHLTTRITQVKEHHFKSEGKVLVQAGWLAIYGKEAEDLDSDFDAKAKDSAAEANHKKLVAIQPNEEVLNQEVYAKALTTKPPARYTESTLLGAMEGAGKTIEDDELREAMQEKGLGTPATRAATIEGLLTEKYLLREGRELVPTAKAFQLMTLLRGLGIQDLCRPELTGEWEYKLSQVEKGQKSRSQFMQEIATMTEHMVQKAKEYDRDNIPGDYATLQTPCPQCGGVVRENYRRYSCTGKDAASSGCGFSFTKTPAGRAFEASEVEAFIRDKRIGPLTGFRSKAGWPFVAELTLVPDTDKHNWKLEFDFGEAADDSENGELAEFSGESLGSCPDCGAQVYSYGKQYVCEKAVASSKQVTPSCTFKSSKTILQQVVEPEQMQKLLANGKTDLLENFVSMRTRRSFKAYLVWDAKEKKVAFEFEAKEGKAGRSYPRKGAAKKTTASKTTAKKSPARKKSG